jgi:hypothetical protein
VAVNGKLVEQFEIDVGKAIVDPWEVELNKIGDYNPWNAKEENEEKEKEDFIEAKKQS